MASKKVSSKKTTAKPAAKSADMTAGQKKLPPFIQAAIAKKKKGK